MNLNDYKNLPEDEKKQYQSKRTCPECGTIQVRDGHSTGDLHVVCPECHICWDCEDGE